MKEKASYNRGKGSFFPTKLQNFDALEGSRKHSRKLVNILLSCIIFGLFFHLIYLQQMLCDHSNGETVL